MSEENLPEVVRGPSVLAEAEKARAISQMQTALTVAKRFPRDEIAAETRMLTACKRYSLAERAVYAYPRAGQTVSGPSIRLAEVMARHWGNMDFGFTEIEQNRGESVVESFCHDLETNVRAGRTVTVHHKIRLKDGRDKMLTDPREIYEQVANQSQRRVRACILQMIPGDIVDKMVEACKETLKKGEKAEPLVDRVKRMVVAFDAMGVSKEMLEKRLKHKIELTTADEMVELTQIFNSLKDGMTSRDAWFSFGTPTADGKAAELIGSLESLPVATEANTAGAGSVSKSSSQKEVGAAPPRSSVSQTNTDAKRAAPSDGEKK